MKKIVCLILVLVLCMGLMTSAFAAGTTVTLPEVASEPGITFTVSNVLDTYSIELNMLKWQDGEEVAVAETVTVYRLSESGSVFTAVGDGEFMFFPGGDGSYKLDGGKFVPNYDIEYYGQMTTISNYGGSYELSREDYMEDTHIFAFWYAGVDGTLYFTYGDLSAYEGGAAGTTEPAAPAEPEAPAAPEFNDVAESDYFFEPVKWAVANGITDGTTDTTFSPKTTCSVAHILTFLWRAVGCPEVTSANPFSDISGSEYYYNAALWAYENGLISGTAFNGSSDCTRSMTVTYLWKLAGQPAAAEAAFDDVAADAEYAQAVAWAVAEGITDGTSDATFSPNQTCTRGQIVTFLWRDLA